MSRTSVKRTFDALCRETDQMFVPCSPHRPPPQSVFAPLSPAPSTQFRVFGSPANSSTNSNASSSPSRFGEFKFPTAPSTTSSSPSSGAGLFSSSGASSFQFSSISSIASPVRKSTSLPSVAVPPSPPVANLLSSSSALSFSSCSSASLSFSQVSASVQGQEPFTSAISTSSSSFACARSASPPSSPPLAPPPISAPRGMKRQRALDGSVVAGDDEKSSEEEKVETKTTAAFVPSKPADLERLLVFPKARHHRKVLITSTPSSSSSSSSASMIVTSKSIDDLYEPVGKENMQRESKRASNVDTAKVQAMDNTDDVEPRMKKRRTDDRPMATVRVEKEPLYTKEQVKAMVELALKAREEELGVEWTLKLNDLLSQQFESFNQYSLDYLSKELNDSDLSYIT